MEEAVGAQYPVTSNTEMLGPRRCVLGSVAFSTLPIARAIALGGSFQLELGTTSLSAVEVAVL